MIGSASKVLCKSSYAYYMCICKRLKTSKLKAYQEINLLKSIDTMIHGPVIKKIRSTTQIKDKNEQSLDKENTRSTSQIKDKNEQSLDKENTRSTTQIKDKNEQSLDKENTRSTAQIKDKNEQSLDKVNTRSTAQIKDKNEQSLDKGNTRSTSQIKDKNEQSLDKVNTRSTAQIKDENEQSLDKGNQTQTRDSNNSIFTKNDENKSNTLGQINSSITGMESELPTVGHSTVSKNIAPHRKSNDKFKFILNFPLEKCSDDNVILKQYVNKYFPSVTKIISETQSELSKFYLERWKKKMISEMGEKAFMEYQEATLRQGINLHANIQHYLSGVPETDLDIDPKVQGHWKSIHGVLEKIEDAVALEEPVMHNVLCYQGKFDCIGVYRGKLCVIDWKTSKKIKPTIKDTFDNPLQVAAYIGAINNSDLLSSLEIEEIRHGAMVIAYEDGSPAHVHVMDQRLCEENWKKWLERLHTYWIKRTENETTKYKIE